MFHDILLYCLNELCSIFSGIFSTSPNQNSTQQITQSQQSQQPFSLGLQSPVQQSNGLGLGINLQR